MRAFALVLVFGACGRTLDAPPAARACVSAHPDGNNQAKLGLNDCATGPCQASCGSTEWGAGATSVTDACARCVVDAVRQRTCTSRCQPGSDCEALLGCLGL